jgi:hypothetical protein
MYIFATYIGRTVLWRRRDIPLIWRRRGVLFDLHSAIRKGCKKGEEALGDSIKSQWVDG